MKKIKLFLCVALFGAMSFGVFSVYEHYTMSAEEMALLENIEALTYGEGDSGVTYICYELISTIGPNYTPVYACQPGGRCPNPIDVSRYESQGTCTK